MSQSAESFSRRGSAGVLPALLALLSVAAIALAVAILWRGAIDAAIGPIRLRAATAGRPLAGATLAVLSLLALWRHSRFWRTAAIGLLIAIAPLVLLLGRVGTSYPIGDTALIELYTLNATRGHQVLGAYSQYLWHHPGPLSFYAFAPFYVLGGYSSFGVGVGVLFVNLGSIGLVAWLVARERTTAAPFAFLLFALLVWFVVRVPGVLTSAWNPHTPLFPLTALLFVSASSLTGRPHLLPLAALLTSFIVQTHIGFAPIAGVLFLMSLVVPVRIAVREREQRGRMGALMVLTLFLLQALWAGPLAEQIMTTPGNMTLIARFFFGGGAEQRLAGAWTAWGTMLAGVFRPSFELAIGHGFAPGQSVWPRLLGTGLVLALVPCGFRAWRGGRRLTAWLACACFLCCAAGLWSVFRIRGVIGDYHIFWLAPLGVVSAAVAGSELAIVLQRVLTERLRRPAVVASVIAGVSAIAWLGCQPFIHGNDAFRITAEGAAVRRLTDDVLQALPKWQATRPIVRFDEGVWATGSGLILQLERKGVRTTVAPEMIWLLGANMASDGREDVLLTVSERTRHLELIKRPHNVTMADAGTHFVDAISLIDDPDARPR